jgi:hypothetical protein
MGLSRTAIQETDKLQQELRERHRSVERILPKLRFCIANNKPAAYVLQMAKAHELDGALKLLAPDVYDYVKKLLPKEVSEPIKEDTQSIEE